MKFIKFFLVILIFVGTMQSQVDRSQKPKEGKTPSFSLPKIQKGVLSNGLKLMLVEQSELPIVQMQFVFQAGATYDPVEKPGLFNLMMRMMDAGTKKRSLLEISDEFAFLGSRFSASTNYDGSFISVTSLKKDLEKTLEIAADILQNSIFPEIEFTRIKNETLTGLTQQKDRPEVIAGKVFSKILYGDRHPYGNPVDGTEESVKNISVEDVRAFFENYIHPDNATLIVAGDVKMNELKSLLENKLITWKNGETKIENIPAAEAVFVPGIYIVDKAKAPQSQIRVGSIGVRRNTPDYFALEVMNMILGGAFNSRINWNLREQKGYTYGARSSFAYRKEAGPFSAGGGFKSSVTDSCVYEILAEIKKMRDSDVAVDELEFAKNSLVRGFPRTFETLGQIAGYLGSLVLYNLPDDYYNSYIQNIEKVTIQDVRTVSEKYLQHDKMAVVIVGDVELNKSALEKLNLGKVNLLDANGKCAE
ncbi:MAG: pitrilysin family protein [Bacteroidota bacterium]|nr:pitrilysin family protein [Bacteroidota bacterium]